MGDEQDTGAELLGDRVDGVEDAALHRHVERRRRLVGDEQPWSAGQPDGDEGALPHPAGELVRVLCRAPLGVGDADEVQQLEGPRPGGLAVRDVVDLEGLGDLVADPHQRVEVRHRVLWHQTDAGTADAPHLPLAEGEQVAAVEHDPAGGNAAVGRQEPVHRGRRGRLPRTRLAHERHGGPGRNGEGDVPDSGLVTAGRPEDDGQTLDREDRHGRGRVGGHDATPVGSVTPSERDSRISFSPNASSTRWAPSGVHPRRA